MIPRYLAVWFLLAVVGVVNGALREATYGKYMSELAAHQVSTVTGILATGIVVGLFSRMWPLESATQAWIVGGAWLLMTVAFEFSFGRYVAGHSWERLFADYALFDGRLWLLFLAWITVLPWLCYRFA